MGCSLAVLLCGGLRHVLQSLLKEKMPSDGYKEGIFFPFQFLEIFLAMNMDQGFPDTFY